ncbi:MAG: hypothetical protein WAW11_02820 [Patescibacteria group bacterium]
MKNFHVNIIINEKPVPLFVIGYTSDGGFFVKDLINDNKKFVISKITIPERVMNTFGNHHIYLDKCKTYSSYNSPKITHHVDGNCHISGHGIISGFYKFFKGAKGVFSKSINLRENNNDGGPIFIFGINNIEEIKKLNIKYKKGIDIKERDVIIDKYFSNPNSQNFSFILEFFYFLKNKDNQSFFSDNSFSFKHRNYGIIPLKYLPCPENSPGYIGIFTRRVAQDLSDGERNFSFSFSGGVGMMNEKKEFEEICVSYPFDEKFLEGQNVRNLDLKFFNKLKFFIDDVLFGIKKFFH